MTITLSAGRYTISLQKAVEQTTTLKTYQKGLGVFAISTSLTSSTYGGFSVFNRYAVDGVKPMLVYNFENGIYGALPSSRRQELDDLVTITRASTGTYIDASGVIQTAAIDAPRFDYSTGARALLLEGSATNFATRSSHTDAYPWNTSNTLNGITATRVATGLTNGGIPYADYSLTGTATSATADLFVSPALSRTPATLGQTWTSSVYTRLISGTWPAGATVAVGVYEETAAGVYLAGTSGPGVTPTDNTQRTTHTRTTNQATVGQVRSPIVLYGMTPGVTTFTGQVIRLFGWQLEQNASATSLIQTLGGVAVTRAADNVAPIDLSGYDLSDGYTVVAWGQMDAVAGSYDRVLQLDNGSNDDRQLMFWSKPISLLSQQAFYDNVLQGEYSPAGGPQLGDQFKMAFAVGPNYFQAARNGVVGSLDTSVTYVVPNVLRLAKNIFDGKPARLSLSRIAIYPGQLPGAELEGITA